MFSGGQGIYSHQIAGVLHGICSGAGSSCSQQSGLSKLLARAAAVAAPYADFATEQPAWCRVTLADMKLIHAR